MASIFRWNVYVPLDYSIDKLTRRLRAYDRQLVSEDRIVFYRKIHNDRNHERMVLTQKVKPLKRISIDKLETSMRISISYSYALFYIFILLLIPMSIYYFFEEILGLIMTFCLLMVSIFYLLIIRSRFIILVS
jgi:hypothetical protein